VFHLSHLLYFMVTTHGLRLVPGLLSEEYVMAHLQWSTNGVGLRTIVIGLGSNNKLKVQVLVAHLKSLLLKSELF
jgi:hypothetical protein